MGEPLDSRDPLSLFPASTREGADGVLSVGGCGLQSLAEEFGTPLQVFDESALRSRAAEYLAALHARRDDSGVLFASKALPCLQIMRLMGEEGLGLEVAGGGELAAALAAGADPARILMHGNAKTVAEIEMAIEARVGTIVIDNEDDIDKLEQLGANRQHLLLRVLPGVDADTHEAVTTGHLGSKFGLPIEQAAVAIDRLRRSSRLILDGLHVHVGSQLMEAGPVQEAIAKLAELGEFEVYDLGGGLGARYTYDDHPPAPQRWVEAIVDAVERHLPAGAKILLEPGRSLVAEAGLTLYTVVSVKRGSPTFVAVDGGMADNLEVAIYGQRFEAAMVDRPRGGDPVELVGRQCESGDRLVSGVPLNDPRPGDLVALPVTGAYCFSLSNNYNGALRSPLVLCRDGEAKVAVRRETYVELLQRQIAGSD